MAGTPGTPTCSRGCGRTGRRGTSGWMARVRRIAKGGDVAQELTHLFVEIRCGHPLLWEMCLEEPPVREVITGPGAHLEERPAVGGATRVQPAQGELRLAWLLRRRLRPAAGILGP